MTFDPTKPIQTRNGYKAEIVDTNLTGKYSLLVIIETDLGNRYSARYHLDGTKGHIGNKPVDLINIPEEVTE